MTEKNAPTTTPALACCYKARVSHTPARFVRPCGSPAKGERDGRPYCGRHLRCPPGTEEYGTKAVAK